MSRCLQQVASGLSHMHELQICHGDVKAANILLFDDGEGGCVPKLCDFGMARGGGCHKPHASSVFLRKSDARRRGVRVGAEEHVPRRILVFRSGPLVAGLLTSRFELTFVVCLLLLQHTYPSLDDSAPPASLALGEERPMMMGTPGFMPPEVMLGAVLTHPCQDVFAMGVLALIVCMSPGMARANPFTSPVRERERERDTAWRKNRYSSRK